MRRALVLTVSAAVFMSLFGGLASARSTDSDGGLTADTVVRVDDDIEVEHIWKRCRRLFGDDELTPAGKERCLQLWKRWCNAHPDWRRCHRPHVPPRPCRTHDRPVDHRCPPRPCERIDHVTDRPCQPHPCVSADGIVRCLPVPTDRPVPGRPTDRPADAPPKDRIFDRATDRLTDRVGNDVHLRAVNADS